jgi:hypothetical protein
MGWSGCIVSRVFNLGVRLRWVVNFTLRPCCFWAGPLGRGKCGLQSASGNITYLVILWSRVLLEKLTFSQPVKKFLAFYGTRMFITAVTSVRHLSLSWASSIQSIPPHPTSWRSIFFWKYWWREFLVIARSGDQVASCPYVLRQMQFYGCSQDCEMKGVTNTLRRYSLQSVRI